VSACLKMKVEFSEFTMDLIAFGPQKRNAWGQRPSAGRTLERLFDSVLSIPHSLGLDAPSARANPHHRQRIRTHSSRHFVFGL
jgi:hypothetical protein